MQNQLNFRNLNFRLVFLFSPLLLCVSLCGCKPSPGQKARNDLRNYLVGYADGNVSSNVWDGQVYEDMLNRLDASQGKYIYLYHEVVKDSYLGVYWFGEDENLPGLRIQLKNGSHVDYVVTPGYRSENSKEIRQGMPQFFSIDLDGTFKSNDILKVELIVDESRL